MRLFILICVLIAGLPVLPAGEEMQRMLKRFKDFEDFTALIEAEYYRPVDRAVLWEGAFRGMLSNLDPHSRFLTKREVLLRSREPQAQQIGFGFDWHLDAEAGRLEVARVVDGGPADLAGVCPGDLILSVDGQAFEVFAPVPVNERMLGLGETCSLQVRHADGSTATAALNRAPYPDNGVADVRLVDPDLGIGCIRISRFVQGREPAEEKWTKLRTATTTGRAFRLAVETLAKRNLKALVLDLRGNGGGSLQAAVEIADAFLNAKPDDGTLIVAQISRNPAHQARYLAHSDETLPRWPLAVLVDRYSASSAEILAAALKDHRRAVVAGETTRGKASIQQQFLLDDGSAILLTVAQYRTPSGLDLGERGVTPDIPALSTSLERQKTIRARQAARSAKEPTLVPEDPAVLRCRDALSAVLIHAVALGLE